MFLPQPSLLVCMQQRLSADAAWGERMGRCGDVTSRKCHSSAYNETLPGISKHCSGNNTCMHHKSSKAVIKCLSDTGSEWKNMPLRLVFACVLSCKAYSTTHQFWSLQFVVLCLTCPLAKISLFRSFLRRSFPRSFFPTSKSPRTHQSPIITEYDHYRYSIVPGRIRSRSCTPSSISICALHRKVARSS